MSQPEWGVTESTPIREFLGLEKGETVDGRRVGGDFHVTVDLNENSPTFGESHTTLRLPGDFKDEHSS